MHARCSRQTRYSRWLAPSTAFPRSYLHSLLAGTAEHIAVVAVADGQPDEVIGLASAALTSVGRRELGILVEDHCQAQGVGKLMLGCLTELVDPTEPLCAFALAENRWLLGKLARLGTLTFHHDSGFIEVDVDRAAHTNRETKGDTHDEE